MSIESIKLVEPISRWELIIKAGNFLNIGCSKGAFIDVLLKNDAAKIYAQDTSRDTLDISLKGNDKIVDFTGRFLRELTFNTIVDEIDGCIIDEPLLSMDKILPFIHPFLKKDGFVISIIKPQLEVSKENLKNNGSVRNTLGFTEMFETLKKIGLTNNLNYIDHVDSPIIGKDGQQEFIILYKK